MNEIVPDGAEPVIGYRIWKVHEQPVRIIERKDGEVTRTLVTEHWLQSINGTVWTPGEPLEAKCVHDYALYGQEHDSPKEGCSCGVYSAESADELMSQIGGGPGTVWGEVKHWGKIIPGTRGYKAQFGYPAVLCGPDEDWLDELGKLYGCPVMRGRLYRTSGGIIGGFVAANRPPQFVRQNATMTIKWSTPVTFPVQTNHTNHTINYQTFAVSPETDSFQLALKRMEENNRRTADMIKKLRKSEWRKG